MLWEYERKEANDKRLDALLVEKGNDGWELAYAHRGKQTRVNTDPDWWELIFKRPRTTEAGTNGPALVTRYQAPNNG